MRGVTVVGTGIDAGELEVARTLADALGAPVFVTTELGGASPVIAARHAGKALDPAALVAAARAAAGEGAGGLDEEAGDPGEGERGSSAAVVAAAPGGLLAPLSEHYSNRDFARELGLPLVVAARAAGGLTGQVRLVGEAARAAGLAVAAVVLTGWPDPPNRVQLDERELLSKIARAPVIPVTDLQRAEVASWLDAEPPAASSSSSPSATAAAEASVPAAPTAAINLDPYDAWQQHQVGDPRNTPRPRIMHVMLEIIEAEGPLTASRAYALYNRAAGGKKLTSVARAPLSSAVYWLAREEKITLTREADIPWQGDDMVRLPDQPAVRLRELGPRGLDEVPLDEIAELIKLLRAGSGASDPTELKRAVLSTYGLVRLTARADEYLGLAIDLAG